jgi:hypothetical protein
MIDPALRKLRLDRRLMDRRGWIAPQELERELAALPDVSAKVAPTEDAGAGAGESPTPDSAAATR